jgi:hypothetical protein
VSGSRSGARAAILAALAAALAGGAGAGAAGCVFTRACKAGTLLVTVRFEGSALGAAEVVVDVAPEGQPAMHKVVEHQPGAASGTIEIDFPAGYQSGQAVQVTLAADSLGATLATASATTDLTDGCSTMGVDLGGAADGGSDGGGAGGQTGAGGAGGSSGAGGAPPVCTGTPPAQALVTDFGDAIISGTPAMVSFNDGGVYTYNTGGPQPVLSLVSGAMDVSGTVAAGSYAGFGLYSFACVDGSAYTGVTFTLGGSLSHCQFGFGANIAVDDAYATDPDHGACVAANCYSPSKYNLTPTGAPQTVLYSQMSGGMPIVTIRAQDLKSIVSLEWKLSSDGTGTCTYDLTLDDVTYSGTAP